MNGHARPRTATHGHARPRMATHGHTGLGGVPVAFSLFMEFIPTKQRGFWLVVIEFFWTIGSITEGGLAWLVMPSLGWRCHHRHTIARFSCLDPHGGRHQLWLPHDVGSPHFFLVAGTCWDSHRCRSQCCY